MVAPDSLERHPVKRRFFHALLLPDHVKYFALNSNSKELRRERGGTLDEYKIVKTMKDTCLAVTLYVCYKMTNSH